MPKLYSQEEIEAMDENDLENMSEFEAFLYLLFKSDIREAIWITIIGTIFFVYIFTNGLFYNHNQSKVEESIAAGTQVIEQQYRVEERKRENVSKVATRVVKNTVTKNQRIKSKTLSTQERIANTDDEMEMLAAVWDQYVEIFPEAKNPFNEKANDSPDGQSQSIFVGVG